MTTTMGTATFKIASTRRLADRGLALLARDHLDAPQHEFIEGADMFFLATCDHRGLPTCSYKGATQVRAGARCVVAGLSNYDGNRKLPIHGEPAPKPPPGCSFSDFEHGRRLRLTQGWPASMRRTSCSRRIRGTVHRPGAGHGSYPNNCPRYIHEYQLVERSAYVPRCDPGRRSRMEAAPRGA